METEFQVNWVEGNLSDIADIIMGQSPPGNSYNEIGNGIGLINGPTEFTNKYPIVKQWTTMPTKICKSGDILLCVRGSSTGRMNLANDEYCIGRGIASIRAKDNESDTDFIYYTLNYRINQLLQRTEGSTFPNLSSKEIKAMIVGIPSRNEQEKISAIISTWDKAIELKEKLIEQKKEQKKGLMNKLLSGKIRITGFKDDWKALSIDKVCNLSMGKTPSRNSGAYWGSGYKWIAISDMKKKYISQTREEITELAVKDSGIKVIPKGTVIMSFKLTIGKLAITTENMYSNEAIVSFSVKNEKVIDTEYLYYYLSSIDITKYGSRAAKGITLNKESLKEIIVKIPTLEEQIEIRKILSNSDREIELLKEEVRLLSEQKKSLMQKLLTGKIRVKV